MNNLDHTEVVVTGLGAITSLGIGADLLYQSLLEGRSGLRPIQGVDLPDDVPISYVGQIPDYDPLDHFSSKRIKRLDRFAQFALISAREALRHGGISAAELQQSERAGVFIGTAVGGFAEAESEHTNFLDGGISQVSPSMVARAFGGAAHSQIAQELQIHGPGATNWNSCAAGNCALGEAFHAIRRGDVDVALAGGVEAPLSPMVLAGFHKLRTLSTECDQERAMCAFDEIRSGFAMAEGGAILLLESREHAERRGAVILARFSGFGMTHEAHHPTSPEPSAKWIAKAIELARRSTGSKSLAIDLVCAHGSATVKSDPNELRAFQMDSGAFSESCRWVTAHKSNTGHTLGAGGAIEAVATIQSLMTGSIAPVPISGQLISLPKGLRIPVERPQDVRPNCAANISLGFGGIDSATLFEKVV